MNIFLIISIIILALAILAAGAVFLYDSYLKSLENQKAAQIQQLQKSVNQDTVDSLVQLHKRILAANQLINQHVQLSQFFTLLENVTVTSVRFTGLQIQVADDRTATLSLSGTAKNFNALAAESKTFAGQKSIKSAIFSGIKINTDNSVSFTVDATLDRAIVVEAAPQATAPATQAATTTQPVVNIPAVTTATSSGTGSTTTAKTSKP